MSSEVHTSAGYIKHHLQNLTYGQLPDGAWGIAHSAEEAKAMGFTHAAVGAMVRSSYHADQQAAGAGVGQTL